MAGSPIIKPHLPLALLALGLVLAPLPALAKPSVVISHAWIALPPGGAPTAAGYLTVKNIGRAGEVFLGGATPAAQRLELHSMTTVGGVMRMRPAASGVVIAPGQTLTLTPGVGCHLMLIRPTHAFKAGERIPVSLAFAKAGALTKAEAVKTVFVVEAPAMAPSMTMP